MKQTTLDKSAQELISKEFGQQILRASIGIGIKHGTSPIILYKFTVGVLTLLLADNRIIIKKKI